MSSLVDSRRAWFIWVVGLVTYTSAVLQRTSFGVAGVYATERYHAGASVVSLFVVVQLATYAAMQIPVGVLSDRFGSKVVLACGALLMCLGQVDLAYSQSLVSAVVARVLVGAGDAMTFSSVVRLLPAWFSAGRLPVLVQLTAMLGQAGQLLSSIPLAAVLRLSGWTAGFVAAGSVSGVVAVLVLVLLRDAPPGVRTTMTSGGVTVRQQVGDALRLPGTRLAFWIHWLCAFWGQVFAFMWGYPFLTQGLGYSPAVTSWLFTVLVVAGFPFGPLVGLLSRRAPLQRTNLALAISITTGLVWLVVLLWPGVPPVWLMVLLMVALAATAPGSMIGLDVARAVNPGERVGTATGVVIVGGFAGGLVTIWLIGLVLDLLGGLSLRSFKVAMATQFLFFGMAATGAYVERSRARRLDAVRGVRHTSMSSVLRREVSGLRLQWRLFRTPGVADGPTARVELPVGAGRTVEVTAVVPGVAGNLVAIDVPPPDADGDWWSDRLDDYLDLTASLEAEVGSVEVRVPDQTVAAAVRTTLALELDRRGAHLDWEVVVR